MKSVGQPGSQKPVNDQPIAIIGMGCRLPGIKNVAEYWEVLRKGIETTGDIPKERWDVDALYDPTPGTPGKIATRRGGFLEGLDLFDPYFFGISPREATYQDPQQRLMLETAWEAMEDAGVLPAELLAGHAGAILGVCQHEYASMQQADLRNSDLYVGSGGGRAAAGRLCTALGMDGPATTVDTACSSSLVAVHLACNALRYGDADLMFAGGVNVILTPALHVGLSQGGMLSPDGRCKSFDISADGYVRSEGATMVLLKPHKQAIADGNQIHGVIRATSMTNDGPHSPLMTPSAPGQELALREAYERAGVDPADVQYVEAHGTGTRVGDPIEMEALAAVLTPGRSPERPLHIGSCKTNIGHTEAAAGTAGLIKTLLSMKHSVIPPSLHCNTLNPNIPWDEIPVVVQRKRGPWPKNGSSPKLAGVNSFGISGTNAHVVVESAPKTQRRSRRAATRAKQDIPRLLPISARTEKSLRLIAEAYCEYLEHPRSKSDSLDDICYTAALHRVHFDHRLGVVGGSRAELAEHLKAFVDGEQRHQVALGQASPENEDAPVFVFSGAGSHWAGMGTQLYKEEPAFAAALDRCDAAVKEHAGWSVIEEINRPESESRCGKIEFQPVLVALQIALFEMWTSWGVKPAAVVGHSVGEYSSAYASGALTLEEAMRSVCTRSGLIKRIAGKGRMLAVGIGLEQARACISGLEDRVSIGVVSGPQSIVLSGDPEPLEEIMARLEKEDIFCRWVKVDVASHSPQTEDVASELAEALRDLHPRENDIPIYSTVTGDVIEGTEFGGEYWMANMRDTVLFAPAIEKILGAGHRMFVEVSPHPVLAFAIDQTAQHTQHDVTVVPTLRRDEDGQAVPLQALAGLYAHGYKPPWETLFPEGGRVVPIPTYQWQRESFWVPMKKESQVLVKSKHAYLGYRWESAQHTGSYTWDFEIDLRDFPFLLDHSFQGTPLLPAAGYVDLALAGSIEVFGPGPRTFRNVELHKTLAFSDGTPRRVQLVLTPDQPGSVTFKIFCREQQADLPGAWVLYSKGLIELSAEEADDQTAPDLESVRENYPLIDREGFYGRAEKMGLGFGPSFQCVQEVWCRGLDDDAFSVLQMPESARGQAAYHAIHPGLLDSIFQSFIAYASPDAPGKAGLPVGIKELFIHRVPEPDEKLFTRFSFEIRKSGDTFGEVRVFDEQGKLIIHEIGHHSKRLGSEADSTKEQIAPWLYELEWQKQEWPEVEGPTATGTFLVFGDQGAVGDKLKESIESQGAQCIVVPDDETAPATPEDFDALLERLRSAPGPYQIVYLWGLDGADNEDLNLDVIASDQKRICGSALLLVQAITRSEWEAAPKLWIITRAAQPIDLQGEEIALSQSPLIGMSRTIGNEYPALRGVRIDLDPSVPKDETEQLLREMASVNPEREVVFRSDRRYALRMARIDAEQLESSLTREISLADDGNRSCELAMKGTGILDNLKWKSVPRRTPGPGQVEIRIIGTALNFLDVLRSLGMMPGAQPGALQFGMECAGRVVAIGEGVDGLKVGDEVVALDAKNEGLLRAYTTLDARVVQRKPEHMSALEAVTMPVVYQTAYYSLHHLARLRKGESILIHSAAGGVGLAALHLAQQIGAEVYATVGNEEKREYLRSRGVKHILDSHSLDFAEEILSLTGGRGVDVVLNSLAGEAIPKSLSTLV